MVHAGPCAWRTLVLPTPSPVHCRLWRGERRTVCCLPHSMHPQRALHARPFVGRAPWVGASNDAAVRTHHSIPCCALEWMLPYLYTICDPYHYYSLSFCAPSQGAQPGSAQQMMQQYTRIVSVWVAWGWCTCAELCPAACCSTRRLCVVEAWGRWCTCAELCCLLQCTQVVFWGPEGGACAPSCAQLPEKGRDHKRCIMAGGALPILAPSQVFMALFIKRTRPPAVYHGRRCPPHPCTQVIMALEIMAATGLMAPPSYSSVDGSLAGGWGLCAWNMDHGFRSLHVLWARWCCARTAVFNPWWGGCTPSAECTATMQCSASLPPLRGAPQAALTAMRRA